MRRHDEAEQDIREALRLAGPAAPPQWSVTLSHVHRGRGELDQALAVLREVHQRAPMSQIVLSNLAEMLATRREHREAYDLLKPLVDRGADRPGLLAQFGRVCRFLGCAEEALAPLAQHADRKDTPATGQQQLLFELGMVLDVLGRYDEAFAVFTRANALESRRYDIEGQSAAIETMISQWSRDAIGALPRVEGAGEGLVFIVGMRRSGTTLAERILGSHPQVCAGGELPHLRRAAKHVDADHATRFGLVVDRASCAAGALADASAHYLDAVKAVRGDAAVFTDKMPANFKLLGLIQLALPSARVVWCRRDPVDTCLSCYMQPFNDNSYCADLVTLARYYDDVERLGRHWRAVLDLPTLDLQYETLVTEPEVTVRRLLDFCELPYDEACLSFERSGVVSRTASTDQVARGLYTSSIAKAEKYSPHLGVLRSELEQLGHLRST